METYEVLEKALALIEDQRNWTMGIWCDSGGRTCAVGALMKAQGVHPEDFLEGEAHQRELLGFLALEAAIHVDPPRSIPTRVEGFNDSHTHAEVVALFQEAIRNEKAKAGVSVELPADVEVPA